MKVIQLKTLWEYALNMSAEVWDVFIHLLSSSEMEKKCLEKSKQLCLYMFNVFSLDGAELRTVVECK